MPILITPEINYRVNSGFTLALPSMTLEAGEWVCITGANGSGKSTLLEVLAGTRECCQEPLQSLDSIALVRANPENQFFFRRVEQELVFPLENLALPRDVIKQRLDEVTGILNLQPLLRRDPWNLSGGQKQLIVLAVALMQDPQGWFLDDALAYLDNRTAGIVTGLLQRESQQGKLIVTVTQDRRELQFCDRVIHLAEGSIEFSGTTGEFRNFLETQHPDWLPLVSTERQPVEFPESDTTADDDKSVLLTTQNLEYAWSPDYPLFSKMELELPAGSVIHLQGEMGSGKTTLALLLAGLLRQGAGEIVLGGEKMQFQDGSSFAADGISYTFQYPEHQFLLPTFRRELEFLEHSDQLPAIIQLLVKFGLTEDLLDEPLAEMPRGYRRLLALLELLASDQKILLLDEPFIGLDIPTRTRLIEMLRELRHPERSCVVIDHLLHSDELGADLQVKLARRASESRAGVSCQKSQ
jgi:energy-coupling factor transporter ATP-binding protein EcfA2